MNQLTTINPQTNVEAYRASTEAATLCKEIVVSTATTIQGRKYVGVEGWQAIAIAHGCTAGARDVERVDGGVRAVGEVRRMADGTVIATAEGFVGEDEPTWFGGNNRGRNLPKRPDYAIRAMAQTRAISRACRSAFAHVVVMMNAGLATTPAEEVPFGGFDETPSHDPRTGEIIEGTVVQQEPAARQKLDGPHTSKTALRKAVVDLITLVRKAESVEAVDALKAEHKRTINQALRDWPALINGDPNIPEDIGLKGEIEKRREALSEGAVYSGLVEALNQCETKVQLQNFLAVHGDAVDSLDGAESRKFELAYQFRESLIEEMDKVHS